MLLEVPEGVYEFIYLFILFFYCACKCLECASRAQIKMYDEEYSQKGTLILGGIADILGTKKSNYTMFM